MGSNTKILVCPDVHAPFHDRDAFNLFLKVARKWKPNVLVLIGDFADCYSISAHRKDPGRQANLVNELALVNKELDRLEALRIRRVIYCCGNHENRFERYIADRAPELFETANMKTLLKIKERGWEWVPYQSWTKIGKLAFSHDIGYSGKTCAQQSLASFGGNIVIGHSHRGAVVYSGTVDGTKHVALNVGWLGDNKEINYLHKAQQREWQHGFGIAHLDPGGNAWCSFIPIINKSCIVDGTQIKL